MTLNWFRKNFAKSRRRDKFKASDDIMHKIGYGPLRHVMLLPFVFLFFSLQSRTSLTAWFITPNWANIVCKVSLEPVANSCHMATQTNSNPNWEPSGAHWILENIPEKSREIENHTQDVYRTPHILIFPIYNAAEFFLPEWSPPFKTINSVSM